MPASLSCPDSYVSYLSDLFIAEWEILEPTLLAGPVSRLGFGRPRHWSLREMLNAVFYVVRNGCSWRMLPREFPPGQTVYCQFRRSRRDGMWERLHTALRERYRIAVGREATPSRAVMDSQSVKTADRGGLCGFDGVKKIGRRKRQVITDTTERATNRVPVPNVPVEHWVASSVERLRKAGILIGSPDGNF